MSTRRFVAIPVKELKEKPTDQRVDVGPSSEKAKLEPSADSKITSGPIIGILSHPGDGTGPKQRLSKNYGVSYICASYVRLVQCGGGRVIPIIYDEPEHVVEMKLNMCHGLLFTGGWAGLPQTMGEQVDDGVRKQSIHYRSVVEKLVKWVIDKNKSGIHFPLYAMCLGFELLMMIVSQNNEILSKFDAKKRSCALEFQGNAREESVFGSFPRDLIDKMEVHTSESNIIAESHTLGITPTAFAESEHLKNFFQTLTLTKDAKGESFVSTVCGHNCPVTGFQWHPEKTAYEFGSSEIPHSLDAVRVTQHVANFLVSEARKCPIIPLEYNVRDFLVYNYPCVYCGSGGIRCLKNEDMYGYDEVYLFNR